MIRARFQQRRNGKLYRKGEEIKGLTSEQEEELLDLKQAYKSEKKAASILDPSYLSMDNTWRQIFNSLKNNGYQVREGMTKSQMLEQFQSEVLTSK